MNSWRKSLKKSGLRIQAISGERKVFLTGARRTERLGLDSGRSQVMVAGAVGVARLLRHLNAGELTVSISDLLEGALMDFLEGEQHG